MTENATFDYVVVGGGTAGAIVAARLSEDPDVSVCLFEAGPSGRGQAGANLAARVPRDSGWGVCLFEGGPQRLGFDDCPPLRPLLSPVEGPIDPAYTTTPEPRGNPPNVPPRAAVLGGCSSHNTQ